MKVYPDTKIFIISPGNIHSGGPELVHQLASQLLKMDYNVYMFYLPANADFNPADPVDPFYKKYHIPFVRNLEIDHKNIMIVPESSSLNLYVSKKIRRIMWWMSVDNYINNLCNILKKFKQNPLDSTMPKFFYFDKDDNTIEHWVQSEYAKIFIKKNGIVDKQIYRVRDYLNEAFLQRASHVDISQKENIVAYNPVKGFEFTQKLLKVAPEINWQAIRDMTPEEVQQLLARAKVYIDFGNHPGRDRIPREAAVSGCCVLTGRRGAAGNPNDIAIDESFKFNDTDDNLIPIVNRIKDIFANFRKNYESQRNYREQIMAERAEFDRDVKAAFNYKEPQDRPKKVAVLPNLHSETIELTTYMLANNNMGYIPKFVVDDKVAYRKGVTVKSDVIKTYETTNYLTVGSSLIPVISTVDAAFLYREQRIEKFAAFRQDVPKVQEIAPVLGIREGDILIFDKK